MTEARSERRENSVREWLEHIGLADNDCIKIFRPRTWNMYRDYNEWCHARGVRPFNHDTFVMKVCAKMDVVVKAERFQAKEEESGEAYFALQSLGMLEDMPD